MEDFITAAAIAGLIYLGILGWKQDKRWARILLIALVLSIITLTTIFLLYVNALGQANWSL